jgi:hypothetical protein
MPLGTSITAIHELTQHYQHERNHQGMSNLLLFPPKTRSASL